jgi:hypothetical protein
LEAFAFLSVVVSQYSIPGLVIEAAPKGFPKHVGRLGSQLDGFPCFPYLVISMACFGYADQKITVTAKARFRNRSHLSARTTLRSSRRRSGRLRIAFPNPGAFGGTDPGKSEAYYYTMSNFTVGDQQPGTRSTAAEVVVDS